MSLFVQRGYSSAGICLSLRRRWETVWPCVNLSITVAAGLPSCSASINAVTYRPGPPSVIAARLAGISPIGSFRMACTYGDGSHHAGRRAEGPKSKSRTHCDERRGFNRESFRAGARIAA